jgi:hypothetical protein
MQANRTSFWVGKTVGVDAAGDSAWIEDGRVEDRRLEPGAYVFARTGGPIVAECAGVRRQDPNPSGKKCNFAMQKSRTGRRAERGVVPLGRV